jgi:alkylation response protein AidB-like acyl-CoA dehydrogenase
MNFDHSAEQLELRDTVARARANGADWTTLASLGLFTLLVPEAYGGMELTLADIALVAEELGASLAPLSVTDTLIGSYVIAHHGGAAQQARWLPRLAEGKLKVALALTEAGGGYDAASMATSLSGGILTGRKLLVPHADTADAFLVPLPLGVAIVERQVEGFVLDIHDSIDPSCRHHRVDFNAKAELLDGFAPQDAAARLFDVAATVHAGLALGAAREMMTRAAEYARIRIQFDRPIGSFQAIKHKCADMYTMVEAARAAAYYAFCAVAESDGDGRRAASMAKAYCGETAIQCCEESIQVHGGMGFTWDLGLHHFLRRARVISSAWGDTVFHRDRVMAITLENLETAGAQTDQSIA